MVCRVYTDRQLEDSGFKSCIHAGQLSGVDVSFINSVLHHATKFEWDTKKAGPEQKQSLAPVMLETQENLADGRYKYRT